MAPMEVLDGIEDYMVQHGFASVAEFHYLHHAPDGRPYDNPGELAERHPRPGRRRDEQPLDVGEGNEIGRNEEPAVAGHVGGDRLEEAGAASAAAGGDQLQLPVGPGHLGQHVAQRLGIHRRLDVDVDAVDLAADDEGEHAAPRARAPLSSRA